MKHLNPIRLAQLSDGLPALAAEAAHLEACPACRAELAVLRALTEDLAEMPVPPKALRQATLKRLGLTPARQPVAWNAGWLWGPALAAGLACALVLPRVLSTPKAPRPSAAATIHPPVAQATARHLPPCSRPPETAPAAQAAPAAAEETVAMAPQVQGPQAGGGLSQTQAPASLAVSRPDNDPKPAPGADAWTITVVRNNLLRTGDRLGLTLELSRTAALQATVLDARGRIQATLFHGPAGPGALELEWDGSAPSGAYTVLIQACGQSRRVKVLVVR